MPNEDGRVRSTRNLSSLLDNNCIGRISVMYLFWNSRVFESLQLPRDLEGKL